jgi:hypothetical protein
MKTKQICILLMMAFLLAACAAAPAAAPSTSIPASEAATPPEADATASNDAPSTTTLQTPIGDLIVASSRFVEDANGAKPYEGYKLLLVILEKPDKTRIDLQQFVDAKTQVIIRDDDGSEVTNSMGGYVGTEFALGFQVPDTFKTYHLLWGDNPPLELSPEG